MATYIMLTRLTDKGAETIKENPTRIQAVDKELEKFGVKVVAQYAVLGSFDFVSVLEAPDPSFGGARRTGHCPDPDAGGGADRRIHRQVQVTGPGDEMHGNGGSLVHLPLG